MNHKNENNFVALMARKNVSSLRFYFKNKAITINTKNNKNTLNLFDNCELLMTKKRIQSTIIIGKKQIAKTYP